MKPAASAKLETKVHVLEKFSAEKGCKCGAARPSEVLSIVRSLTDCKNPKECLTLFQPEIQEEVKLTVADLLTQPPDEVYRNGSLLTETLFSWNVSLLELLNTCWPEMQEEVMAIMSTKAFRVITSNSTDHAQKDKLINLFFTDLMPLINPAIFDKMTRTYFAIQADWLNKWLVEDNFLEVCAALKQTHEGVTLLTAEGKTEAVEAGREFSRPYNNAINSLFKKQLLAGFGSFYDLLQVDEVNLMNHSIFVLDSYDKIMDAAVGMNPKFPIANACEENAQRCFELTKKFPSSMCEYNFLHVGRYLFKLRELLEAHAVSLDCGKESANQTALCEKYNDVVIAYCKSAVGDYLLNDSCGSNDYDGNGTFWENGSSSFSIQMWRLFVENMTQQYARMPKNDLAHKVLVDSLTMLTSRFCRTEVSPNRLSQFKADCLIVLFTVSDITCLKTSAEVNILTSKLLNTLTTKILRNPDLSSFITENDQETPLWRKAILPELFDQKGYPTQSTKSLYSLKRVTLSQTLPSLVVCLMQDECLIAKTLVQYFYETDNTEMMVILLDLLSQTACNDISLWSTLRTLCIQSHRDHQEGRNNINSTLWYTSLTKLCIKAIRPIFPQLITSTILEPDPNELFEILTYSLPANLHHFNARFSGEIGTFGGMEVLFALILDATSQMIHELQSDTGTDPTQQIVLEILQPTLNQLRKVILSYDVNKQTETFVSFSRARTEAANHPPNFGITIDEDSVLITTRMKETNYQALILYIGQHMYELGCKLKCTSVWETVRSKAVEGTSQFEALVKWPLTQP